MLEQKVAYLGAMLPYEAASDSLKTLMDVTLSDSTIFRLTNRIGGNAKENISNEVVCRQQINELIGPDNRCYGQMDGTMIHIRKEGWKEVKLARVFRSDDIVDKGKRQGIEQSIYAAVLGNKEEFEHHLLRLLPPGIDTQTELVFNTDGAVWIRQMIESHYPRATSILDIYHLLEHIGKYVVQNYSEEVRKDRMKHWKELLLHQGGVELYKEISATRTKSKLALKEKKNLLSYLESNKGRTDYPAYKEKNYYIGSGAIESAHRHVIQSRMKKAGQIWSRQGAERMLSLRVFLKNGKFISLFQSKDNLVQNVA